MRKLIVIILIFALASFAAYWLSREEVVAPWDLVTARAWLVLETDNLENVMAKATPMLNTSKSPLKDSTLQAYVRSLARSKSVLVALYRNSNKKDDGVIVIPQSKVDRKSFPAAWSLNDRLFSGVTITDIVLPSKQVLAVASIGKNIILGSSLAVEDVIRNRQTSGFLFGEQFKRLFQMTTLKGDEGNVYVHPGGMQSNAMDAIAWANAGVYDLKVDSLGLLLNGFALDSVNDASLLFLHRDQTPGPFSINQVIPVNAISVVEHRINNFTTWRKRQRQLVAKTGKLAEGITSASWVQAFGNELEVARCEVKQPDSTVTVFFAEISGDVNALPVTAWADTSFYDAHAGVQLFKSMPAFDVTTALWPVAGEEQLPYYAHFDNYIIWGESIKVLKSVIDDIQSERTLTKSLAWNNFLGSAAQESNMNVIASRGGFNKFVSASGMPFNTNKVDKAIAYFSNLGDRFYSGCLLSMDPPSTRSVGLATLMKLEAPVMARPSWVANHESGQDEILVQDSTGRLSLIGDSKVQWQLPLPASITDEVEQVDYFRNRKLQYLFLCNNAIYLVDRLGRVVDGFPKSVPASDAKLLRVVDYDKSRNYRFLTVNKQGNIYLLDKDGKALEGWAPKSVGSNIADAGHYRLAGKDFLYALSENGVLSLFNRRGDAIPGFPVDLKLRQCKAVVVVEGRNAAQSYFVLCDADGMLYHVSFTGKVLMKEPLLRSTAVSKFEFTRDKVQNSAVIVRTDGSKIATFSLQGKLQYEIENPLSESLSFAYRHADQPVIAIFDHVQQYLILLRSGELLLPEPREATQLPAIDVAEEGKVKILYVNGKQLHQLAL